MKGSADTKDGGEQPEEGLDLIPVKAGDYMIHVLLENAKNIKADGDAATLDAMFQLCCCGQTSYSSVQKNCPTRSDSATHWGEHFFFEPKNLSTEAVAEATLVIKLMDKGLFRDGQIGSFEFDIAQLYGRSPEHALHNQWVAFNNPESADFTEVRAQVRVSIAVQGPGDSSVRLQEFSGVESEQTQVMMPASVKAVFKQIRIGILRAEGLPEMDTALFSGVTLNAYVTTQWQKRKLKTKVIDKKKGEKACDFGQVFQLGVLWPLAQDRLVLKLMDADTLGSDEALGSIPLSLKDIVTNHSTEKGTLVWKQLYGAPVAGTGAAADAMNAQPELASDWKGRVLLHLQACEAQYPEFGVVDAPPELSDLVKEEGALETRTFELIAEVGAGICLPSPDAGKLFASKKEAPKYRIRVQIGDFSVRSGPPRPSATKNAPYWNYLNWGERLDTLGEGGKFTTKSGKGKGGGLPAGSVEFRSPCVSVAELGAVFVYLEDANQVPICFWRGEAADFLDKNAAYKWYALTANKALGRVANDHDAGMIQFKLSLNMKAGPERTDWELQKSWKERPPAQLKSFRIRCYIYQCKDLPSADSDGSADPYISVYDPRGAEPRTRVIEDNLNPIFYDVVEVHYEVLNLEVAPPIVVNIWDTDEELFDGDDDFLGRAVIFLHEAAAVTPMNTFKKRLNKPPEPTWHDLRMGFHSHLPACGQVLCSFAVVEEDFHFDKLVREVRLAAEVATSEFRIDINVLGLRELESFGILPIQKAFVKFNTKSMLPPEKAQVVTNVRTEPRDPGRSPNINATISLTADLPVEALYCPKLACEVFDHVCKGLSQPKIGSFTIPIGDIMHQQSAERRALLELADNSLEFLRQLAEADGTSCAGRAGRALKAVADRGDPGDRQNARRALYVEGTAIDQSRMRPGDEKKVGRGGQRPEAIAARPDYLDTLPAGRLSAQDPAVNRGSLPGADNAGRGSSPRLSREPLALNFESEAGDDGQGRGPGQKGGLRGKGEKDRGQLMADGPGTPVFSAYREDQAAPLLGDRSSEAIGGEEQKVGPQPEPLVGRSQPGARQGDADQAPTGPGHRRVRSGLPQEGQESSLVPDLQEAADGGHGLDVSGRSQLTRSEAASHTSVSGSQITFTRSTLDIKAQVVQYLRGSSGALEETEAEKEQKKVLTDFKKALFAGCGRQQAEGQRSFIAAMAKLKARREVQAKREPGNAEMKALNAELLKQEAAFVSHFQENKRNQKALGRSEALWKRAADEAALLTRGVFATKLDPQYGLDDRLKVYAEVHQPAASLYVPLGFDPPGSLEALAKAGPGSPDITPQKHYRRFFADELENDKTVFHRSPFHRFDLTRGQARGLKKGFFGALFGGGQEDPSGQQTNVKTVGYFKGKVDVVDPVEQEKFEAQKTEKSVQLSQMLELMYKAKTGKGLGVDLTSLTTREDTIRFRKKLAEIDAACEELVEFFKELSYQEMLQSSLVSVTHCLVRLYLIEGFDFASRDIGSFSDPYTIVRCGRGVSSSRDKYQIDEPNPKFYQSYEFPADCPGAPLLEIEAYDYDDLFGDDLIGRTVVDLDDRRFCPEWRAKAFKPIEHRELYHPSTSLAQGTVVCWVDIFEQDEEPTEANRLFDITPEPSLDYQVRVSVYNTKNVPMEDAEGTSDVFVRAWLDDSDKKETDTHWRCTTGEASFNYRLLYDIKSPSRKRPETEAYKLKLQIYDRDILSSSDFICAYELDLRSMVDDTRLTQRVTHLNKKYYKAWFGSNYGKAPGIGADTEVAPDSAPKLTLEWEDDDSFWLSAKRPGDKKPIKIRLDVRVLPLAAAQGCKVGDARNEPNNSPSLPAPLGRMSFSLNPFAMLAQLVGPDVRNKCLGCLCVAACCGLCVALLPLILGNLASKLVETSLGLS